MKYLSGDPGKEGQVLSNSVENTSLDCADFRGRSREGTKKRALENGNKKHKNYRIEIWAGGALLFLLEKQK
jgi:hypothetical protein